MIKVAIVEDNLHYRSVLGKLIESSDLFILSGVYASAEEAIPGLLLNEPDIAIVDIQLPRMSGIEMIKKLRSETKSTQFLVCTLYEDNDRIFEALKAGAAGYLLKDSNMEQIRNAIKDLYTGGSPMSPLISRRVVNQFQKTELEALDFGLSDREVGVLTLLSRGMLYKEIAGNLHISENTVKNHLQSIYKKMHVQNKIEAINKYRLM